MSAVTAAPAPVETVVRTRAPGGAVRAPIAGVALDLDGVLADTETQFFRAVNEILTRQDLAPLSDDEAVGLVGLDNESLWRRLREVRSLGLGLAEYTEWVDTVARTLYARELAPADGAVELLARIRAHGLPLGLATSGETAWVENRLGVLGLKDAFDVVVTGDRVPRPKPHPDIYRKAALELGVAPGEALAVEDSPTGVAAAKAAGMFTVAVRTRWTGRMDLSSADVVVGSLHDIEFAGGAGQAPVR